MLTAEARRLFERTGQKAVIGNNETSPIWENNPHIGIGAGPKTSSHIGKRPYIKGCDGVRIIYDENHRPEKGEIYLTDEERKWAEPYAGSILVEPHCKLTFSGNKGWKWDRWIEVAQALPITQCLPPGKRPLPHADHLHTRTIRHALAALSTARLLITTDGALHHAAAALGTPAVVIWGARTNPKILGYAEHENIYAGQGESCGMMAPCDHCVDAMDRITSDMVLNAAHRLLD